MRHLAQATILRRTRVLGGDITGSHLHHSNGDDRRLVRVKREGCKDASSSVVLVAFDYVTIYVCISEVSSQLS